MPSFGDSPPFLSVAGQPGAPASWSSFVALGSDLLHQPTSQRAREPARRAADLPLAPGERLSGKNTRQGDRQIELVLHARLPCVVRYAVLSAATGTQLPGSADDEGVHLRIRGR